MKHFWVGGTFLVVATAALGPTAPKALSSPESGRIVCDLEGDPRIALALERLRPLLAEQPYASYVYVIGREVAKEFWGSPDLSDLGKEGFLIQTVARRGQRYVVVTGAEVQGIAYGVFRLVRTMLSAPQRLPKLKLRMKPELPVREVYEEHGWANPREMERYRQLLHRYLEEGVNTLDLPVGWFLAPPFYLKGPSKPSPQAAVEDFDTVRAVIDYAHSLGIQVFLVEDAYLNPIYHEARENLTNLDLEKLEDLYAVSETGRPDPLLLCLEHPVSRDLLRRNREILYRAFPNADGIVIYFGDPGGCWHPQCRPHGVKIVEYLNQLYAPLIQSIRPGLPILLSLWGIGLEDTEYVVNHLDELPENVIALQIPPTSMRPGRYLTFEPRRGELIRQAALQRPVILQQFYEGVGFRDGWVDFWEHPMPRAMAENFRGSYLPGRKIVGAYGSPFELSHQLVNLRLGMEWAWNPRRKAQEILREYGDEQFGRGVGEGFAAAMFCLENYWFREVRRFHFDPGSFSEYDLSTVKASLNEALSAWMALNAAQPRVTRQREDFQGFLDLAKVMLMTAHYHFVSEQARRLAWEGRTGEALQAAEKALKHSQWALDVVQKSPRYSWLMRHPFWQNWDLGKRPAKMQEWVAELKDPPQWELLALEDPSFEQRSWEQTGQGQLTYVEKAHRGRVAARLAAGPDPAWCEIHPARPFPVQPNRKYRVEFWARAVRGSPKMYVDWCRADADGENTEVGFEPDRAWHRYRLEVRPPDFPPGEGLLLRFVAYANEQELLLDDVKVWGPKPKEGPAGLTSSPSVGPGGRNTR
jgi:hypothetical protein